MAYIRICENLVTVPKLLIANFAMKYIRVVIGRITVLCLVCKLTLAAQLPAITPSIIFLNPGEKVELTLAGAAKGDKYTWQAPAGKLNPISENAVSYSAPEQPGIYIIKVLGPNSLLIASAQVTVMEKLSINPMQANLKPGQSLHLFASGGTGHYIWTAAAGDLRASEGIEVIYRAPNAFGQYTVSVSDSSGKCASSNITIYREITITPSAVILAMGKSQEFSAAGGSEEYSWKTDEGYLSEETGSRIIYAAPSKPGIYHLTVLDNKTKEKATSTIKVIEPLGLKPLSSRLKPGESQLFIATGGTGHYSWTASAGDFDTTSEPTVTYISPKLMGDYVVTVYDTAGNSISARVKVGW